jgi:hypothetical protein
MEEPDSELPEKLKASYMIYMISFLESLEFIIFSVKFQVQFLERCH